jgi:hypothetical protein
MTGLLRTPHAFFRRHLSTVERVLVAFGFACAVYSLTAVFPVYPSPWEVVLAVTIFFVMLWSPSVAYFLAVAAALYPLYSVSLYLAVLFLVIALVGQRAFINNLGALLMVLFTPWLAQYHLVWIVPLLGGLWWGKAGGAWIGALAALWSQLLFGMAGATPDLLASLGAIPSVPALAERFHPAGSLDTLLYMVTPFAPNPTLLLYYLLQVILWAMTAALTGGFAERLWVTHARPLRIVVVIFGGAVLLCAGHLSLAAWLEQYAGDRLYLLAPQIVLDVLVVTLLAAGLEGVRDFVERPFPAGASRPVQTPLFSNLLHGVERLLHKPARSLSNTSPDLNPASPSPADGGVYTPMPVPPELRQQRKKNQKPDDIIKIELD